MGYGGKVVEQERARELRARSWTLEEIAAELGVAKSSVSLWVRDVEFVPRARRMGPRRPSSLMLAKQREIEELRAAGLEAIGRLSEREFLVVGAALYAGEGAKTDGAVKFANTDARMILLFITWLRRFFPVDESRLRIALYLHDDLDLDTAASFWSAVTGIPLTQFTKPYRAIADRSIRSRKHPMGCPAVVYSCSRTHRHVMGLVAALLSPGCLPG
jgi:transcriptional regulator with XRE-family HTH domain